MINMMQLDYEPTTAAWVHVPGAAVTLLAVYVGVHACSARLRQGPQRPPLSAAAAFPKGCLGRCRKADFCPSGPHSGSKDDGKIRIYNGSGEAKPLHELDIHSEPVSFIEVRAVEGTG